jgi:hypothetical protein
MARWEFIKLYYYHCENPENNFGVFSVRGPGGQYEQREVKDLERTFTELEQEGWKIEKAPPSPRQLGLSQPEAAKWQEVFRLSRRLE